MNLDELEARYKAMSESQFQKIDRADLTPDACEVYDKELKRRKNVATSEVEDSPVENIQQKVTEKLNFCCNCGFRLKNSEQTRCSSCNVEISSENIDLFIKKVEGISSNSGIYTFRKTPFRWFFGGVGALVLWYVLHLTFGWPSGEFAQMIMGLWLLGGTVCLLRSLFQVVFWQTITLDKTEVTWKLFGLTVAKKSHDSIPWSDFSYKAFDSEDMFSGFTQMIKPSDGIWLKFSTLKKVRLNAFKNGELIPYLIENQSNK